MPDAPAVPGRLFRVAGGVVGALLVALGLLGAYVRLTAVGEGTQELPGGVVLEVTRWSPLPDSPPPQWRASLGLFGPSRWREGPGGRLVVATVPLDARRVALWLTPPDADARPGGRDDAWAWTHRLRHTASVARSAGAVVMVNGQMFAGESGLVWGGWARRRPGERARLSETAVLDGKVLSWWEHAYLLGFGADLTPRPVRHKPPPPPTELAGWPLALSGQSWQLYDGQRGWWEQGPRRNRTAVGVSMAPPRLYLAVGEDATLAEMADALARRGATYVLHLDGGGSTAMAVQGRAVLGDWRPVANHFGVVVRGASGR
ncbi:MAG: phosphodiester glycosidase family protein [Tepidisphaerales bacterium]